MSGRNDVFTVQNATSKTQLSLLKAKKQQEKFG